MFIRNIYVYDEAANRMQLKHAYISPEGIKNILDLDADLSPFKNVEKIMDANGLYTMLPGMLDSHVHGHGGPDFADVGENPDGLSTITKALGETGLSYVMATLVSLDLSTLKKTLSVINQHVKEQKDNPTPGSAIIVGVHLEGPFIDEKCKGAHAVSALQDSISLEKFREIIRAAPDIKQWKITIAPDLPGAQEFIERVKELENEGIYVKVFMGHTNPAKPAIDKAIQAGAVGFTHLGNACQESCCREARVLEQKDATSQLVQWVLENPDRCPPGVELIVDGMHVSKSFVSLIKKKIGDKIVLVTDALGPSGLPDGKYKLGTLSICSEAGTFYLADENGNIIMKDGTLPDGQKGKVKSLSGSGASLASCVKNYADWTASSCANDEDRIRSIYAAAIKNPRITSLSSDAIASLPDNKNFVILDHHGKLVVSLCNGQIREHRKFDMLHEAGLLSTQTFIAKKPLTNTFEPGYLQGLRK